MSDYSAEYVGASITRELNLANSKEQTIRWDPDEYEIDLLRPGLLILKRK